MEHKAELIVKIQDALKQPQQLPLRSRQDRILLEACLEEFQKENKLEEKADEAPKKRNGRPAKDQGLA
jgi:hypothetical protein